MASPEGNLQALQQMSAMLAAASGLDASADENGAIRPIVIGALLPGAPANVGGASLGCFRYLPRNPQSALQLTTTKMYGFGLDPLKTSPGVVIGASFDVSGATKQGAIFLRPGDWYHVPQGFTSVNVFAADGADNVTPSIPQGRMPLGFVHMVGSLARGTAPSWSHASGQRPTHFLSNYLQVATDTGGTAIYFTSPSRGFVRVRAVPLNAGGNPVATQFSYPFQTFPVGRQVNASVAATSDSFSATTVDDPIPASIGNPITRYTIASIASGSFGAGDGAVLDVPVGAGLHAITRNGAPIGLNGAAAPSDVLLILEWLGESPISTRRVVTIYDATSPANTALDTGNLNFEDFEAIECAIIGNGALAGTPVLTLLALADADNATFATIGSAVAAAGTTTAAQSFSPDATPGPGMTAAASLPNCVLPSKGKITLGAGGAAVTCRLIVYGRRRVL